MPATEEKTHRFDHLNDDELVILIKSIRVFKNRYCSFIGLFNYENERYPNREEMLDYLDKETNNEEICDRDPKQHVLGGDPSCTNCQHYNEYIDFEPAYNLDSPEECELHFETERIQREREEREEEQRKVEEEQRKVKEEEKRKREEEQRKVKEERVANIKVKTLSRGHCPVEADIVDELIIGKCGHGISKEGREGMIKQSNEDPIMRGNVDNCPECGQKNAFRGNTETQLTSQGEKKREKRARIIELCKKGMLTAGACAAAAAGAAAAFPYFTGGKKTRRRKHKKSAKKNKIKRATTKIKTKAKTKTKVKKGRKNKTKRK